MKKFLESILTLKAYYFTVVTGSNSWLFAGIVIYYQKQVTKKCLCFERS